MTAQTSPPPPTDDVTSTLSKAAGLINARQNKEAVALLRRLSSRYLAVDPRADYLLGVAAFRSGDLATAADAFHRCVAADPRHAAAQYGLAKTLQGLGDHQRARQALAAAEQAHPGITANRREAGAAAYPAGTAPSVLSLASILDRSSSSHPSPGELAGDVIWRGRPAVRSIILPTVGPLLLLVVPAVIRRFADALPAGSLQDGVAHLWRLSVLAALLLTVFLSATSIVNWLMRELVIRERRLEIWTGLLGHRHVMLWLHDLERPLTVRQPLWQLALNLGTLEITSTMLPTPKRRRASMRVGHMRFSGLTIQQAEGVAETIRCRSLWERRQMVKNFVSTR